MICFLNDLTLDLYAHGSFVDACRGCTGEFNDFYYDG